MNRVLRARPLLGTLVQISAHGAQAAPELHAAVGAAFAAVGLVHSLMSWHDPDSELSRINRLAVHAPQALHPHTRQVLDAALGMAQLSEGAFDPCVGGTLMRWGLLPASGARAPDERASWRDIELDADRVRFHRPLWVDLGGIAKGYAVDLALQCLVRCGVSCCAVNAGGDLRVAGEGLHRIAVSHPRHAHAPVHQLVLRNEALATSSGFGTRQERDGATVCALVDPGTQRPYAGGDSVSVRAPSCMTADALTKVALFAAPAVAQTVFEACAAYCLRLQPPPTH